MEDDAKPEPADAPEPAATADAPDAADAPDEPADAPESEPDAPEPAVNESVVVTESVVVAAKPPPGESEPSEPQRPEIEAEIEAKIEAPIAPKIEVAAKKPSKPVSPNPVVEFQGVTKSYGDGPSAFTAIKDVSFVVEDRPDHGEFVTILGPSGCGKSTILRLIAGLAPQHPPTRGKVLVDGKPVLGPGADRGMVFQDYTSFDHRTVLENVAFGLECRGMPRNEREERAREWIGKVGLDVAQDANKYPHQLSGGMRQRVAIARTLVLQPRIILMDEPFGALDPSTRMHMQNLLVALWRELEATVFFITHSIEEAVFLGDRIYLLSASPGTLLREIVVPAPERPAKDMQREPKFLEYVFDIRDTIESLESSKRAGDD